MSKKLQDAMKALMPSNAESSFWGKVKSVKWEEGFADVTLEVDGLDVFDVLLGLGNNKIKPKQGSRCLITRVENKEHYFLSWCAEIEEMWMNGDQFGGLADAKELKSQLDKNTQVLKMIQQTFNTWVTVPNDGGAALKAASTSFTNMQLADLSNIQNKVIKHG